MKMDITQKRQIRILISSKPADQLCNQAIVLFLFENGPLQGKAAELIDRRLNGVIYRLIKEEKIKGTYGESVLVASEGRIQAPKILVLGLGEASSLACDRLRKTAATLCETLMKIGIFDFATSIPVMEIHDADYSRVVEMFFDGIVSGLTSMAHTPETGITMIDEDKREDEIIAGLNRVVSGYRDRVRVSISRDELEGVLVQSNRPHFQRA